MLLLVVDVFCLLSLGSVVLQYSSTSMFAVRHKACATMPYRSRCCPSSPPTSIQTIHLPRVVGSLAFFVTPRTYFVREASQAPNTLINE
jgi:hypothetical protein